MKKFNIDFDEINEIIYILDIETYEILYINEYGFSKLGFKCKEEVIGKKCYEIIHKKEVPCYFCHQSFYQKDDDIYNPIVIQKYLLKDQLIEYNGHQARLEIAFDISPITKQQDENIKGLLRNEQIAMECAQTLQDINDETNALKKTLSALGRELQGSRVYIFEINGKIMNNTFEWCASHVLSKKHKQQSLPIHICQTWLETFLKKEPIIIRDMREYSKDVINEFIDSSIKSQIAVPLFENDILIGFLGVDNPSFDRNTNIVEVLQILGYFIQKTLMSIKATEKMRKLTYIDSMTETKNRNAFMQDIEKINMKLHSMKDVHQNIQNGAVFIDVNGLKDLNDTAGHDAGDNLLSRIAKNILKVFDEKQVYRTGGDEFVVLCPDMSEDIFMKKVTVLKQKLNNHQNKDSAAVGCCWSNEALYIEEIINQAEAEMYESKKLYYIDNMQGRRINGMNNVADCYTTLLLKNIDVVNAASELLHLMLEEWNTQRMDILLDDEFVLFEEEYQKLYQKGEALVYLKQQQNNHKNQKIRDMQYIRKRVIKGVSLCSCYGQLDWKSTEGITYSVPLEMTMLFIQKNGRAKCLYIHSTNIFCRSQYTENIYQVRNDVLLNMISRTNGRKDIIEPPINDGERNAAFKVLADAFGLMFHDYTNVYFVDIQKDSYVALKTEGKFRSLVGVAGNYTGVNTDYAENYMDEDTKIRYLEFTSRRNLMDNLSLGNDLIHMNFMISKDTSDIGREIEMRIWLGMLDGDIVGVFGFKNMTHRSKRPAIDEKDRLTSLLSYEKFKEEGQRILNKNHQNWAMISIDIQKFKYVNEVLGYLEGDNILKGFARHLSTMIVDHAFYTRVTGDLFLALVHYEKHQEWLIKKVTNMVEKFCLIQKEKNDDIKFVLRTGIYFIEECKDILTAIDHANLARKTIGQSMKCEVNVFGEELVRKNSQSSEIMTTMERALDNGDFQIWIQPKINLSDGSLCGAEALVRWMQDGHVHFYPDDFIPVFENNGFITSLDLYVLESVCRILWQRRENGFTNDCRISINLSSIDVEKSGIIHSILKIVDRYQIDHSLLEFELTETAYFKNSDEATEVMKQLKDEGFVTSVDDFGSGYSVMNMLINMPATVVKIDSLFMADSLRSEKGKMFLKKIIALIHELGYRVLCEGIETKEQYEIVKEMGCDEGQGYYIDKPMSVVEFYQKYGKDFVS